MLARSLLAGLVASAAALAPAGPASADGAEAFVGGLLGSAIGTAIVNRPQQQRVIVKRQAAPRPGIGAYQREENRQVQTALNYFGFPAGVADGVLGANSRAAIGQYQAFLGYPPTGVLTEYEKVFLTSSWQRAIVGGPQTARLIAANGQGSRGLLLAYRQEQMGVPAAPAAPAPAAPSPVIEAAAPAAPDPAPAPPETTAAAAAAEPGLPSFLPGAAEASVASYCNRVTLATGVNGGFVTAAAMSDPLQALGEQFCLARTYAIEQGESLAGTVQGFTMAEMVTQCEAFAPSMSGYQARLASQDPAEVRAALQEFVASTGAAPAQMSGSARICLGLGYQADDAAVALASSLVLVGLGEEAYGELLGHHLMNGFATSKRPDRGVEWLDTAAQALAAGATPLVANGAQAHVALLEQAVAELAGTRSPAPQDAAATPPGDQVFVLPMVPASSN